MRGPNTRRPRPSITAAPALALTAALALGLAGTAPASAQTVHAEDPASVANALSTMGYRAQLDLQVGADPMIRSGTSGVNYSIFFYGCEDGADCKYLLFSSSFQMNDPIPVSSANDWNTQRLFGEMSIDENGNPRLTYFMTTVGGVNAAQFADIVEWWELALGQFTEHIGW